MVVQAINTSRKDLRVLVEERMVKYEYADTVEARGPTSRIASVVGQSKKARSKRHKDA